MYQKQQHNIHDNFYLFRNINTITYPNTNTNKREIASLYSYCMLLILELIKYENTLRLLPGLAFTLGAFAKSTSQLKRTSYRSTHHVIFILHFNKDIKLFFVCESSVI